MVKAYHLCAMNNNLSADDRRDVARMLYTENDKTCKEIATAMKTEEAAVRQWIQEGEWDMVRRSLAASKREQLERLYEMVEQLNRQIAKEEEKNPKDMDMLLKYMTMINKLETDSNLYRTIEMAEGFLTWLYRKNKKQAQAYVHYYNQFIKEMKVSQPL